MAKTQYNADSITVLGGLEAVRKRPGMYIGSVGTKGLNHLIYEIMDNSVDEHLAGFCDSIWITLEKDGSCTVRDNGRGIPVEMHKMGMSAERVVMTTLHAGGKFDNNAYKTSGGLHGVGSSVVNALSEHLTIRISRGGQVYQDTYARGIPTTKLENGLLPVIGRAKGTGTETNFKPDPEIFEKTRFKEEWLRSRLHETAYLNPGLTIYYENRREGEEKQETFHEPEGIVAYVREINKGQTPIHDPVYFKGAYEGVELECALQFVDTFEENIFGFCNNIYTAEGGTHLAGFKTRFTQLVNTYARDLGILKDKDANFTGPDTRNGMTAVVAVKHPDPIFEGQTKTKLASADASKAVFMISGDELTHFFDRNVETIKAIIGCAEKSAKIRRAEEKARTNMLTKSKFSFDSNGKLANCESKDPSKCEIFIVEGDSAGGSAKTARNRMYQAILPIRGKILNVEKASMDKVLANAEIKTMINAFGCGFSEGYGNDFDITKLRYDKIVLMTDADVDGSHIDTLLLTFLYRFMPELIYDGHVYIAMPPLYKVVPKKGGKSGNGNSWDDGDGDAGNGGNAENTGTGKGGKGGKSGAGDKSGAGKADSGSLYLYDDKALEKYRQTHPDGSFTLQRYKGLGEMDAEQLWETTLNPENRVMKRVEIEDARLASEVTELLMGSEVGPRRDFIHDHADEAEIDT